MLNTTDYCNIEGNSFIAATTPIFNSSSGTHNTIIAFSGLALSGADATLNIGSTSGGQPGLRLTNSTGENYSINRDSTTGFLFFSGTQTTFSGYRWKVNNGTQAMNLDNGGNLTTLGTVNGVSDQRLKTNIAPLPNDSGLDAIDRLNPVTFNWINPLQGTNTQIGFIAQQVQQIFPSLVQNTGIISSSTPDGTLSLNYIGLIVPTIKAVQELHLNLQTISSTTASSTPDSQSFAVNFFQSIFARITAWLADATNGITDFFADNLHARKRLCVGSTCITETQLAAVLSATSQTPAPPPAQSYAAPSPLSPSTEPTPADAATSTAATSSPQTSEPSTSPEPTEAATSSSTVTESAPPVTEPMVNDPPALASADEPEPTPTPTTAIE